MRVSATEKATIQEMLHSGVFAPGAISAYKRRYLNRYEVVNIYKYNSVKRAASCGKYPSTFHAITQKIPDAIWDESSIADLARLCDSMYDLRYHS